MVPGKKGRPRSPRRICSFMLNNTTGLQNSEGLKVFVNRLALSSSWFAVWGCSDTHTHKTHTEHTQNTRKTHTKHIQNTHKTQTVHRQKDRNKTHTRTHRNRTHTARTKHAQSKHTEHTQHTHSTCCQRARTAP